MECGSKLIENESFEPFQPLRPIGHHLLRHEACHSEKHGFRKRAQVRTIEVDPGLKRRSERRCDSDLRGFHQGILITGAARRQTAEPLRAQPLAIEFREEPAQARPCEALVGVGWVAQEGESPALAIIDELDLRDCQERPC